MSSTVVISGATGLIGSEVLRQLKTDPEWQSIALARGGKSEATRTIAVDLSKPWSTETLPAKVDAVIHLAQSEHFREFPEKAMEVFEVNCASTERLLDYARKAGAQTFVLASSGGIYGSGDEEFHEDREVVQRGDLGFYLGTKVCAETLASAYVGAMDVVMLRFFFVYGRGQRKSMLIPRLVESVKNGTPIQLQGEDGIRVNPTHVSDAAAAVRLALGRRGSQKFNVGGPETLTLRQIGQRIGRWMGKEPVFQVQAGVPPRHLVGDIGKMTKLLHRPRVSFEEGLDLSFS